MCNCLPSFFVSGLKRAGHRLHSEIFFDTLKITCSVAAKDIFERAAQREINLRVFTDGVVRTTLKPHALFFTGWNFSWIVFISNVLQ